MFEKKREKQEGQSIVLVAAAMVVLLIFVALAVDMSSAYVMRRKLQNGADGAALAAVRRMSHQLNTTGGFADGPIHQEVIDFAERNTLNGSGGTLADIGGSVVGLYVDRSHEPIPDAIVGDGDPVHPDAWGVQATVYGIAPSFFGGILGRDGYPVQATATAALEPTCGENCLLPIAVDTPLIDDDPEEGECFGIYNGTAPGGFGWVNWSIQALRRGELDELYPNNECSRNAITADLFIPDDPDQCRSGFIEVGDYVGSTTGMDAGALGDLNAVIDACYEGESFTVLVYDVTNEEELGVPLPQCNHGDTEEQLAYRVAGFARMQLLYHNLLGSQGNDYPREYEDAEDFVYNSGLCPPPDPEGFLYGYDPNTTGAGIIVARFLGWSDGTAGECTPSGTLYSPRLVPNRPGD